MEQYRRNWKDNGAGFSKQGAEVLSKRKNKFKMNYEIMEKFSFVVHLTGTNRLYRLT
jgi:hypothetical protein